MFVLHGGGRIGPQLENAQTAPVGGRLGNTNDSMLQSNEKTRSSRF